MDCLLANKLQMETHGALHAAFAAQGSHADPGSLPAAEASQM